MGNHDEAAFKGGVGMTPNARRAIEWTAGKLGDDHLRFLRGLPLTAAGGDMLFVHASAHDPEKWRYIRDADAAAKCLSRTQSRLVFCGHTHNPAFFHALPGRPAAALCSHFRKVQCRSHPSAAPSLWLAQSASRETELLRLVSVFSTQRWEHSQATAFHMLRTSHLKRSEPQACRNGSACGF